ncbi:glycosyltransferase family 4 protein [Aestuariirhabdus sp. LZHN29]|uniref:glycosyltransferase family 4 protein n=1 Tax=Aestuariirhabdus sp. LZHN29 TaxID=3417462 RepID=UPI003CE7D309
MAKVLVMGGFAESLLNFRGALLQDMVRCGHEVFACAPDEAVGVEEKLCELGVTYIPIKLNRTGINPLGDLRFLIALVLLFRSIKPDLFFGYTIKPVIYGSIAAKISGVPRIYSMITGLGYSFSKETWKSRFVGLISGQLYRIAARFNNHIFFQNPDDLSVFVNRRIIAGENKAVLVNGSGVDTKVFNSTPFPKKLSFLLIARLIRDKGIYEYAGAARALKKDYPWINFRLAGWIDDNPHSISKSDLDVWHESGDIEFLGRLSDVRPALADSSVYVLPSFYGEGTPRTVLEAMASGRAVITTDSPGCRETVESGVNGYLIPTRSVDSLVASMKLFIDRPDLVASMGEASRVIAEEKYDVRKVNAAMLASMGLS